MGGYIFDENMKFIGDFDGYFKNEKGGWASDSDGKYDEYNKKSRCRLIYLLNALGGSILEVGCGCGYVTKLIKEFYGDSIVSGVDISQVAIDKAKKLFPDISFKRLDIINEKAVDDVVILNEILWYVAHELDRVLDNCVCKYLIINGSFYKDQKYGKEYVDGFNGLIKRLMDSGYEILYSYYDFIYEGDLTNGTVLCRKKKK